MVACNQKLRKEKADTDWLQLDAEELQTEGTSSLVLLVIDEFTEQSDLCTASISFILSPILSSTSSCDVSLLHSGFPLVTSSMPLNRDSLLWGCGLLWGSHEARVLLSWTVSESSACSLTSPVLTGWTWSSANSWLWARSWLGGGDGCFGGWMTPADEVSGCWSLKLSNKCVGSKLLLEVWSWFTVAWWLFTASCLVACRDPPIKASNCRKI